MIRRGSSSFDEAWFAFPSEGACLVSSAGAGSDSGACSVLSDEGGCGFSWLWELGFQVFW